MAQKRNYLYFAVFSSGMTTLAIELAASRLLGPAFGTSNLVWASIIGLILIYLTLGYFLGGRWADRSPRPHTLYSILAWGAFASGLTPLVARPVLRLAAEAFDQFQVGILLGSFSAVLILFSVPVTLLGMVSPFAIRLAIFHPHEAGRISGKIYAISTLGSFIGTFLPVLLLIPLIGTLYTFLTFSLYLNLVALLGLYLAAGWKPALRLAWMPVALVALTLLARGPIKATAGQIYEAESAYNYIQVLERDGYRYLRLNEGLGIHSVWHPTNLWYQGPWEQFLVGPFLNPPPYDLSQVKRIAIVGLAAGTVARQATAVFGPIPIDGYEIDPQIIAVGRKYFDMNEPNLTAIAQDGRTGLAHSPHAYTLIAVDAYRPPYIPWHLTTREFFQIASDHLTPDGVLAINVGHTPEDTALLEGLSGTLQSLFPSVYTYAIPGTFNTMVYATRQPTARDNLAQNTIHLLVDTAIPTLLAQTLPNTAVGLMPAPQSDTVYTDDWAPIELVTNSMMVNFVLSGEVEIIQQPADNPPPDTP